MINEKEIQAGKWACDVVDDCVSELLKQCDDDLKASYGEAKASLYDWLKRYGWSSQNLQTVCSVIKELTKLHPEEVAEKGTAEQISYAMRAALNSIELGNRIAPEALKNPRLWALANVEFSHDTSGNAEDPYQDY